MSIDLNMQIQINNQLYSSLSDPVKVSGGVTIFSWDFDKVPLVDVDETDGTFESESIVEQTHLEIKIADNSINLGTDLFLGNYSSVNLTSWTSRDWKYIGVPFERGERYYGQIRIIDAAGRTSDFSTFSFIINVLPQVSNVVLSPVSPTTSEQLSLSYDYFDEDGGLEGDSVVRWFKNGVYQQNLDSVLTIASSYMEIGDVWYTDVLPNDGYEYGSRVSSNSSEVIKNSVTITSARILPINPNENDILKADYDVDKLTIGEDVFVRWFVNDTILTEFNDLQYLRYISSPGDVVRFEISTESVSSFLSSEEVTILASDFFVYDIKIDGGTEPLEVSTTTPNILWKNHIPEGREASYVQIQIGTFYESNNIYETVVETNKDNFTIFSNILERGVDYYISIAVSDTTIFGKKTSSHFRIKGSRWNDSVVNSTGWTIETIYLIQDVGEYDPSQYQSFSISDGTFFAEVRLYNNKIGFVSEDFIYADIDSSGSNLLTITGNGNDVKIYLDREIVLDATGMLTQVTADKRLELGNITGSSFHLTYKYIYYTTSGDYHPGEDSEYSNMQFSTFLFLEDNEIVALKGYMETIEGVLTDTRIFASNPDDISESGSVYSIVSSSQIKAGTVSRTFSPINKIRRSPDGKKVVFAHAKGTSVITGYLINPFNFEIDFTGEDNPLPDDNNWELVQNTIWTAAYFNDDGLNINTITRSE